jgi:glucose dehydrogenase
VKNGDPSKGETGTSAPLVIKDKVLIGISGGEFGVAAHVTAYDIKTASRSGAASRRTGRHAGRPEKTTASRQAGRQGFQPKTWQGDQWKIGGGCTWGWISYDPALNLSITARAIPRPGIRSSVRATTNGR